MAASKPPPSTDVLRQLWHLAGLDAAALASAQLERLDPVLPSSFAVGTVAQCSIAAAGLAAAELRHLRGHPRQQVRVDMRHAAMECKSYFTLDGVAPDLWDKISGLYPCDQGRGWVRIHANFAHHRDGVLRLLGCAPGADTTRDQVQAALERWTAEDFETAAAHAGLVVAAARSFELWDAMVPGQAVARLPLFTLEKIGEADPLPWPQLHAAQRPLEGLRVLDLTRILAGPVGGRTLAAYGADVMLVNSPNLPNIGSIAETSRGKLSTHIDLKTSEGRQTLRRLAAQCHVFSQGYRPGGIGDLGFSPEELAQLRPGVVCVSLSAYGHLGPWSMRRGFDSLVQTATGFNLAEARAAGESKPKAMPVQILDYASGFLMAFGAQAALWRQQREGGSWLVRVSLAQTGHWLRHMGQVPDGWNAAALDLQGQLETTASGFGRLTALRHAAQLAQTPVRWTRPSMPPGTHPAVWPTH